MITIRTLVIVLFCLLNIQTKTMEGNKELIKDNIKVIDQKEREFLQRKEIRWRSQKDIQFWTQWEIACHNRREAMYHNQKNGKPK